MKINWPTVAVFGFIVLLAFLVGTSLLGGWGYRGGYSGGMMGPGMMGGWGLGPFAWFGMLFMWLIPVGFVTLIALGVAALVRTAGGGAVTPPSPASQCPNCGGGVQAGWRNCPHCGTALSTT
jgi:hypothetical protein